MRRLFHLWFIFVILFSGCSGFRKTYVIAIDPSFYPANLGGQADNVYGFSIDLLKEISELESIRIQYLSAGSESLLNGLQRKSYDGIITPKSNVGVETNIYDISKNYFSTGPVLVTLPNAQLQKLSQMQSKIVGVIAQSDAYFMAQQYAKIIIYSYPSAAYTLEALKYNQIDSAFMDVMEARSYVMNLYKGVLKISSKPMGDEGLYLVTMNQENRFLIEAFNNGLKKAKRKGSYDKLLKKWNLNL